MNPPVLHPRSAELARLADIVEGHAERFVPELMGGLLIDSEHRGRYWWAAALVANKRVLDAGCGTGYGAELLARGGALDVVGIDRAAHVVDAARQSAHSGVTFEVGDVEKLRFPDESFDVVVCFETIEHVDEPDAALDQFARVLRPDGLLVISSPNRGVYIRGNPHHRHEYTPDELEEALRARFLHVRLVRQHDWLAATIFEDASLAAGGGTVVENAAVRKLLSTEPGVEQYTLALASNGPLPTPAQLIVLTDDVAVRRLQERAAAAEQALHEIMQAKTFRSSAWARIHRGYASLRRLARG